MPDEFYRLTWNQYKLKCKGYFNRQEKDKGLLRWAVWYIMSPHVTKMPSMKKLMPLSFDKMDLTDDKINRIKQAQKALERVGKNGEQA